MQSLEIEYFPVDFPVSGYYLETIPATNANTKKGPYKGPFFVLVVTAAVENSPVRQFAPSKLKQRAKRRSPQGQNSGVPPGP